MSTVSVIIPAYNAERYICDAIKSALSQSYSDLEVLVIDDGSKDGTAALVAQRFPQVRLISKVNGGASSARNLGCQMAKGEFLAFLDADDEWHTGKIAAQLALMKAYPQAQLCRTALTEDSVQDAPPIPVGADGLPVHTRYTAFKESFFHPFFATSTVMVRRSAFDKVGGFDVGLKVAEDIDFYLRVLVDAPVVPMVSAQAIHKRPVKGSLGDDSEYGYIQLLAVYKRFLAQFPATRQALGSRVVRQMFGTFWARYAASQLRNGKRLAALGSAFKALAITPSTLAVRVILLAAFKYPIASGQS
jgi:glycosyltransferase involved in cell wall biosynthesis